MKMNPEDVAVLDRLFGPRLPDEMADYAEEAKAVQAAKGLDLTTAVDCLLRAVVHDGCDGVILGWRAYEREGFTHVAVCRISRAALKAA